MDEAIEFEVGLLTFEEWLDAVDLEVIRIAGLGREDFADWTYADAFEDGVEPIEAARDMLAEDTLGKRFLDLADIKAGL